MYLHSDYIYMSYSGSPHNALYFTSYVPVFEHYRVLVYKDSIVTVKGGMMHEPIKGVHYLFNTVRIILSILSAKHLATQHNHFLRSLN